MAARGFLRWRTRSRCFVLHRCRKMERLIDGEDSGAVEEVFKRFESRQRNDIGGEPNQY